RLPRAADRRTSHDPGDAAATRARLHACMSDAQTQRLLVVATRTECAPHLLQEIERRAHADATFLLIVPPERHPDAPDWTPDEALRLVQRPARRRTVGPRDWRQG